MLLEFYTYKEIKQQPRMWGKAYEIIRERKAEIAAFVHRYIDQNYQVVLTGAGTSAYIGDALEAVFSPLFSVAPVPSRLLIS